MRDEIGQVEGQLATTAGTCAVMGTASTMACIAETLGMALPGTAAIPAVHADRLRAAEATGDAAVALAQHPITPRADHHAAVGRERTARAAGHRRLDQRDHPSDRDRRPARHRVSLRAAERALATRRRCWSISSPPASTTWRTSSPPAVSAPCCASCAPLLHLDCVDGRPARRCGERLDADRSLGRPRRDPRARRSRLSRWAGSSRCSASLAPRGAILKRSAADASAVRARGPRGRVRLAGGSAGAHRRSGRST